MDDKIERVVRSVLEAVDARLAEVRHEVAGLAQQVVQRNAELSNQLAELDHRFERQMGDSLAQPTGPDPLAARMEQATQVLLERIEAMHQRTSIATNERFATVHAMIDQLRSNQPSTVVPATPQLAPVIGSHGGAGVMPEPRSEAIDLGRVADLLSERLRHFDLPTQSG